jgi:uncharacterized protein YggE
MINRLLNNPIFAATFSGVLVAILLSAFLIVKIAGEIISWDDNDFAQNVITVSGEGESLAIPNIATFSFSIIEKADTIEEAQELASQKVNQALAFLRDNGVEDKDIKTNSYNTYPNYDYGRPCTAFDCPDVIEPEIINYEVSQRVTVKVRQQEEVGRFLTELGRIGVSNLSGLSFEIDDDSKLYEQARENAINDAKEKAKKLAKQLGVDLGDIVSFNENSPNNYKFDYRVATLESADSAFGGSVPELPQGENTYKSTVSITYEID